MKSQKAASYKVFSAACVLLLFLNILQPVMHEVAHFVTGTMCADEQLSYYQGSDQSRSQIAADTPHVECVIGKILALASGARGVALFLAVSFYFGLLTGPRKAAAARGQYVPQVTFGQYYVCGPPSFTA